MTSTAVIRDRIKLSSGRQNLQSECGTDPIVSSSSYDFQLECKMISFLERVSETFSIHIQLLKHIFASDAHGKISYTMNIVSFFAESLAFDIIKRLEFRVTIVQSSWWFLPLLRVAYMCKQNTNPRMKQKQIYLINITSAKQFPPHKHVSSCKHFVKTKTS